MDGDRASARGRGMTREYWCMRVLFALQFAKQYGDRAWIESSVVARLAGRPKSSHFMGILNELRDAGYIHMDTRDWRPNQSCHVWAIDDATQFKARWHDAFVNEYSAFAAAALLSGFDVLEQAL